jgi:hypothetical protein
MLRALESKLGFPGIDIEGPWNRYQNPPESILEILKLNSIFVGIDIGGLWNRYWSPPESILDASDIDPGRRRQRSQASAA